MQRSDVYFVSDVHLGLQVLDPAQREQRFVSFLRRINVPQTRALYMLGDIFDFWYEWKYTVPKGYVQVLSALQDLVAAGIEVFFFQGNHDVWTYSYFEQMGMKPLVQPCFVEIDGKVFCLGHGDALGQTPRGYRFLRWMFHNKVLQCLFNTVHPTIAMALGNAWSRNNRLARREQYVWKDEQEPLVHYAREVLKSRSVDFFIFGHLHVAVDYPIIMPDATQNAAAGAAARLIILDSWIYNDSIFVYRPDTASQTPLR